MQRLLKAPVIFLGLSLPEHGYHAINENFDWGQAAGRDRDVLPLLPPAGTNGCLRPPTFVLAFQG